MPILGMQKWRLRKITSPSFHSSSVVALGHKYFSTSLQQMRGNFRKKGDIREPVFVVGLLCAMGCALAFRCLFLCGRYNSLSLWSFREIM